MQVPSHKPPLAAVYLDLLQTRPAALAPPAAKTAQPVRAAPAEPARASAPGHRPPARGSLVDILA